MLSVSNIVIFTFVAKKIWGFPRFGSNCTSSHWRSLSGTVPYKKDDIVDSCSDMMLQLRDVYDIDKVNCGLPVYFWSGILGSNNFANSSQQIKLKIKVLCGSPSGVVADEAKKAQTHWVILDK